MDNLQKNILSLIAGCVLSYSFIFIIAEVAALPVPQIIQEIGGAAAFYFSNLLIVILASLLSSIFVLTFRKACSQFTKQNLFYFSLPIVLFLIVFAALSLPFVSMAYAAAPSLLIATLLSNSVQKI
ncbi:hypothetical protein [Psychrosphaera aestuarii]|uniref:hypothetical protein n=1 Tax=Psychrosphaera aestuarii TaxID=1266052 RepID=UPI001B3201F8|nr:hypothetical protein [Psychrosphaera aestuarii]